MARIPGFLIGAALALTSPAFAETEDGLYGAAVPSDAVFLRRIGAMDALGDLFGRSFTGDELPDAVYVAISATALEGAEPGAHYTVTGGDTDPLIIREPARADPSKVYLFLLNTDPGAARLVVAGGGPTVIEATPQGQMAERAVNPLAVTLSVEAGGLSQDFDLVLRRGVNLTFIVADGAVRMIENRFGPVITAD